MNGNTLPNARRRLRRVLLAAVALPAAAALWGCGIRSNGYAVNTVQYVKVRDSKLYLEVRGKKADAPVMLWLHGGPGGAERPMFRLFNRAFENEFRVAYLDQRGAGRSYRPDEGTSLLKPDQHVADLDRVVDYLRQRYGAGPIILVGHSWGAQLGILYAEANPAKVSAVVAVNPVISELRKQEAQFQTLAAAAARGDAGTASILSRLGRPPYSAEEESKVETMIADLGGIWFNKPNFAWALARAVASGLIRPSEIGRFIEANRRSLRAMNQELLRLDLANDVKWLETPIVLMVGMHDLHTPPAHAMGYLEMLRAPMKLQLTFRQSAHNIPFEEPAAFHDCLFAATNKVGATSDDLGADGSCPYEIVKHLANQQFPEPSGTQA